MAWVESRLARAVAVACASLIAWDAIAQTTTQYTYDSLGRLKEAVNTDGKKVVYDYDDAGNRVTLGNGAPLGELKPASFSASSNAGSAFSGLTTTNGMKDLVFNTASSAHITAAPGAGADSWIKADLGAGQSIDHIDIAPPDSALSGGGAATLNGAVVEYSLDNTNWSLGPTVDGVTLGVYRNIALHGVQARYVRVRKTGAAVGVGDFRLYSTAAPYNQSPVARGDVVSVAKNQPLVFDPRVNDTNDDGALVITAASGAVNHQSFSFTSTSISYTPRADFIGTETLTYTVSDAYGLTANAQVTINVVGNNNRPPEVHAAYSGTTSFQTPKPFDLSSFVLDRDNDPLQFAQLPTFTHGSATSTGGLTATYNPPPGWSGTDQFSYRVSDGKETAVGYGSIQVLPASGQVNNPPLTVGDSWTTSKNQEITRDPRTNDFDPENQSYLVLRVVRVPPVSQRGGTMTISPDKTQITYRPPNGVTGLDSFQYTVDDGTAGSESTETVTVYIVGATNNPPTAVADNYTMFKNPPSQFGSTLAMLVLQNDNDLDDDALAVIGVSDARSVSTGTVVGTVNFSAKTVNFTPTPSFVGSATINYTISDGRGGSSNAITTVNVVNADNHLPVGVNKTYNIPANDPFIFDPVTNQDSDPDQDPIWIGAAGMDYDNMPARGAVVQYSMDPSKNSLFSNFLKYTPEQNVAPYTAQIVYVLSDGRSTATGASSNIAIVTLNVGYGGQPAPQALPTRMTVIGGGKVEAEIHATGSYNLMSIAVAPSRGTAEIIPPNQVSPVSGTTSSEYRVVYTASEKTSGTVTFQFRAQGAGGVGTPATVTVQVEAASVSAPTETQNPVVQNYTNNSITTDTPTQIYLLGGAYDPDGDPISLANYSAPNHGVVTNNGGGYVSYRSYAGYLGSDSFAFVVSDGHGGSATGTVNLTIVPPANTNPVAVNDTSMPVGYNSVTDIPVLNNDTDADGDPLTVYQISGAASYGSAMVKPGGSAVTYTPNTGYSGPDNFTYTITDGRGGYASGQAYVVVQPRANASPQAGDDTYSVAYNIPATLTVRDNDSDPDGDALTINSVTLAAHGSASAAGLTVTYTPFQNYVGADAFTYTVSDGKGGAATARVTLTVLPAPNRAPSAANDNAVQVPFNTAKPVSVLGNDSDPDGDALSIIAATKPPHGQATFVGGQAVTYVPDTGYVGADSFTYTTSDGRGGTASATVNLTVQPAPNTPPVARDNGPVRQAYNTPVTINVLGNDSDADGDTLSITAVNGAQHGQTTFSGPSVTFTPAANYSGYDNFAYSISDGRGGSDTARVLVEVMPANNQAPSAVNDGPISVTYNTAKTITVLANDTDADGDTLSISAVGTASKGTVAISGTSVIYTPTTGQTGADSFTYTVSDGRGGSATATVSVTIGAAPNTNPTAVNDGPISVTYNTAKTITVLSNDTDADGDTLSISSVGTATKGTVTISGTSVIYTPTTGQTGADSFTYTVADGRGGTATATVSVTIGAAPNTNPTSVNDGPISVTYNTAKTIAVLANDSDADNDTLSISAVGTATKGTVVISGTSVIYTPTTGQTGADSFTYTVSDGRGGTATATVSVTIGAAPNTNPTAVNDGPIAVTFNTAKTIAVLANDTDADNDTLSISAVGTATKGTVAISGTSVIYTPTTGQTGADSFTYTVADGRGGSATATVSVTIGAAGNQPPVAVNYNAQVSYNSLVGLAIKASASDPDGDPISFISVTQPSHGVAQLLPNDIMTYSSTGYSGPDSFTYTISDGRGGTATATIFVTVGDPPTNQNPTAVNDGPVSVIFNTAKTIAVLANDTDADNDTLSISAVGTATKGTVTISSTSVIYTPTTGQTGADSFTYTVSDGHGGTATGTVTVEIEAASEELIPTAFSASSSYGSYSGLTTPNGMRDGQFLANSTIHGTNYEANAWIMADLGAAKTVGSIKIAPADAAADGSWGAYYVNGAAIQYSTNGSNWTTVTTVSGASDGAYTTVNMGGVTARYVRLYKSNEYVGLGDFRLFAGSGSGEITPPANTNPIAVDDGPISVTLDTAKTIPVLTNDIDADGDTLSISAVSTATKGTVAISGTSVVYTPTAGATGADSFTYTISDGRAGTDTATVSVTISVNHSPTAVNDGPLTNHGIGFIYPRDNDSDPDGDPLSLLSATQPSHGEVQIVRSQYDEHIEYTSAIGYVGPDSFTYTISDGRGGTATATISVTVQANRNPTPADDGPLSVAYNTAKTIQVLLNDYDDDSNTLIVSSVGAAMKGTVSISGTSVVYTPNAGAAGGDSFTYVVSDGRGGTATATVFVTIAATSNTAPTAMNDGPFFVRYDTAKTIYGVLGNDSDADGDALTISAIGTATKGTVTISDTTLVYTPTTGSTGPDSFTYTVSDGKGGTATATVSLDINTPYNRPPVAVDDDYTFSGASLLYPAYNDSDPDGDWPITLASVTQPSHGSTHIDSEYSFLVSYSPTPGYSGLDNFTYTISDGRGGTATATVHITIPPVNHSPTAVDDGPISVALDTAKTIPVLTNDIDADGDTLSISSVGMATKGTVAISGTSVIYTPTTGQTGSDSFAYTVSDGNGGTASAVVTVTITAPNQSPIAVNDGFATLERILVPYGAAKTIDSLLANDSDPDGDTLSISAVGEASKGTVAISGTSVVYTPTVGATGIDSFTYTVSDGRGGTATANVSVTINAPLGANVWTAFTTASYGDADRRNTGVDFTVTYSPNSGGFATLTFQKGRVSNATYTGGYTLPGSVAFVGNAGNNLWEVSPGERLGIALEGKPVGATTHVDTSVLYYNSSGQNLGTSSVTTKTLTAGSFVRTSATMTAPTNAAYAVVIVEPKDSGNTRNSSSHGIVIRKPQFHHLAAGASVPAYGQ
jgi:hypothetical protein